MLSRTPLFCRTLLPIPFAAALFVLSACGSSSNSSAPAAPAAAVSAQDALATATPIKHVVVIFGENRSFDHYFGTYPNATNPTGEPTFTAAAGTPTVNGLTTALLTANPTVSNTLTRSASTVPKLTRKVKTTDTRRNSSLRTVARWTCTR
jgi:phospholipase C